MHSPKQIISARYTNGQLLLCVLNVSFETIKAILGSLRASLVAQRLKPLPAMRETRVWSLGWEDPLEKGMATHSSILAWRIPWTEEPGGLQSTGSQRVGHDWATSRSLSLSGSLSYICQIAGYYKQIAIHRFSWIYDMIIYNRMSNMRDYPET